MKYNEKTISSKNIYNGNIIDVNMLKVILPNGREAKRDIVSHPGAAVIIPISKNEEIFMVRQYRKPIEKVSLEVPAGKLDQGEKAEVCARRELKEETGLSADNMKYIISVHSTPGFCDEVLHFFVATGLREGEVCADEDEIISCEKIALSGLLNKVFNNEITDAKTIIGIFFAEKILRDELKIK